MSSYDYNIINTHLVIPSVRESVRLEDGTRVNPVYQRIIKRIEDMPPQESSRIQTALDFFKKQADVNARIQGLCKKRHLEGAMKQIEEEWTKKSQRSI